jgi:crossover junction endodeoxyribonuclease RuvC
LEKIILGIDPGTNIMGFAIIVHKNNQIEVIDCGILSLKKEKDGFTKLKTIFEFVISLIQLHHPDELSIESQFYAKNIQSMLKLGRAQGVAIAAALSMSIPVFEYSPRRIKQAVTGNGNASKEQVAGLLETMYKFQFRDSSLDASDALAVAVCHCYQNKIVSNSKKTDWKSFISQNPNRIV